MSEGSILGLTFSPSDGVPPSVAPFAHATIAGPTLFVTGQMPTGLDGELVSDDIGQQTDQVMRNLSRVLELAGGTLGDVVQVRAYLIDWDEYAAFNAAYERWFPERLPSRTCVGVTGLAAGARVEIDVVAWRQAGWSGGRTQEATPSTRGGAVSSERMRPAQDLPRWMPGTST